jgi:phosphoribosylaminoimidazole carboxylase (NCAIR synthetase)
LTGKLEGLVPAGDFVIDESSDARSEARAGGEGRAFCPTPRALRVLERAGATRPLVPELEVLRRVNHRAFSAGLGPSLPGARYVRTREDLLETLASSERPWVLKRAFGFAGRGRQRLRSNELDASVEPFVRASLESGDGLEVEPWVVRSLDVGLHGFITPSGEVTMGDPTRQDLDASGAWIRSVPATRGVLDAVEDARLREEGERVAHALRGAGYFGPFGIDAFRWKDENGAFQFNPRSEINARYSMGWAVGMGNRRPDLEPRGCGRP